MESSKYYAEREFWRLAWPASVEGLIVVMLFAVNLVMVSSLGTDATSAVGIFGQPQMVILCVSRSFSVAVSALISMRHGQGKMNTLPTCLKQSFVLTVGVSFILLVLSQIFLEPVLSLSGAKADYMDMALDYGRPSMIALFFLGLSTVLNAGLLGIGQTRVIMIANVIGNLCNFALNAVLIYGRGPFPALGVAGAGYGMLVGSVVSFAITFAVLLDPNCIISLRGLNGWRLMSTELKPLWEVFTGAFAEQGVERVGMFLYSRMIADLGTIPFAVHTICMNLCNLYYSFAQGMGKASLVLAGMSLGAQDKKMFLDTGKAGKRIGFFLSVLAFGLYILFRIPLIEIYDPTPQVLELGVTVMLFVAVVSFPEAHALICSGTLRGAGMTRFVAIYSLISIAIVRPILTWALCFRYGLGLYGAWSALLFDQMTRAVCSQLGVRYVSKRV